MAGLDLTDRIKMINMSRRSVFCEAEATVPAADEVKEQKSEERMIEAISTDDTIEEVEALSLADEVKALRDEVAQLSADVKLMNKHVNSIVKYIKKH